MSDKSQGMVPVQHIHHHHHYGSHRNLWQFSEKCLLRTRLSMVVLSFIGIVILAFSVAALVWVTGISAIWTIVHGCNSGGNNNCRCVGDNCTTMNENATAWHKFCFGGGIAGITIGMLCIIFGVVWGCLSNYALKRKRHEIGVNTEGTT